MRVNFTQKKRSERERRNIAKGGARHRAAREISSQWDIKGKLYTRVCVCILRSTSELATRLLVFSFHMPRPIVRIRWLVLFLFVVLVVTRVMER